jgi:hypothetical protein
MLDLLNLSLQRCFAADWRSVWLEQTVVKPNFLDSIAEHHYDKSGGYLVAVTASICSADGGRQEVGRPLGFWATATAFEHHLAGLNWRVSAPLRTLLLSM